MLENAHDNVRELHGDIAMAEWQTTGNFALNHVNVPVRESYMGDKKLGKLTPPPVSVPPTELLLVPCRLLALPGEVSSASSSSSSSRVNWPHQGERAQGKQKERSRGWGLRSRRSRWR